MNNGSTNDVEIETDGLYQFSYSLSFAVSNNTEFEFAIFLNGVEQKNSKSNRRIAGGGDVGNTYAMALVDCVVSDVLDLRVKADAAFKDFLVFNGQATAYRVA